MNEFCGFIVDCLSKELIGSTVVDTSSAVFTASIFRD